MKNFLEVVKIIPAIVEAMKVAETIVPLSGKGAAKLQFVLGVLADTVGDISPILETVTKVISRITALFNSTGTFNKGA